MTATKKPARSPRSWRAAKPKTHREVVEKYIDDVLRGKTPACKRLKAACQRHRDDLRNAKKKKIYFDEEKANDAIDFAPLLTLSTGEWNGKPLDLKPFQKFIVWSLFGWRRASDGMRRFRRAFITMASGNAKSPLAAYILLYCFAFDWPHEARAECYVVSTKQKQCRPVFDEICRFRAQDKHLRKLIRELKTNLSIPSTGSKIEMLGAEGTVDDGMIPHVAVIDEEHRFRDHHRESLDTIKRKMGKRRQPLLLIITTAGDETSEVWQQDYDMACKVVERGNRIEADDLFVAIWEIDEADDPFDARCWAKANPMLEFGVVKLEQLRDDVATAKIDPRQKNSVIRLRLNRKVTSTVRAITSEMWATGDQPLPDLAGMQCFGGFDWGFKDDLAAMAYVFALEPVDIGGTIKRRVAVMTDVWIPEDGNRNLAEEPWASWIRDGWLIPTHGKITDTATIYATIEKRQQQFGISTIAIDPNNAREFGSRIQTDHGIEAFWIGTGFNKMNEPTRELLAMLHEGRLVHGGNPLLAWTALNLVLETDSREYCRPAKKRCKEKIDPIVAVIYGVSELLFQEQAPVGSYYETHDVESA
jgi:phage terminase large subunit-like protein